MSDNDTNTKPQVDRKESAPVLNKTPRIDPHSDEAAKAYAAKLGASAKISENEKLHADIASKTANLRVSLIINFGFLVLILVFMLVFAGLPKTKYIATKDNSAICEVYPSDNPNITDASIREFGKDAVLNLYTFDYVNYENQVNTTLERNFTPIGRQATIQAMEKAGIFTYVKDNALTFRSSASNAARIEQKDVNTDGKDFWIVRFPMVLDIYSGKQTPIDTQKHMVTVRVVADTASSKNPNGLGISSVTLSPL